MLRKIVIAVDGSSHSRRAIEWYASSLNEPQDLLIFVCVTEPPPINIGDGLGMIISANQFRQRLVKCDQRVRQLDALVREKLADLELRRQYKFVQRISSNIGAAIVAVAKEESAAMIVMANRGSSIMRRTFLGSVSEFVLHHSPKPVIIVPPKKEPKNLLASSSSSSSSSSSTSLSSIDS